MKHVNTLESNPWKMLGRMSKSLHINYRAYMFKVWSIEEKYSEIKYQTTLDERDNFLCQVLTVMKDTRGTCLDKVWKYTQINSR